MRSNPENTGLENSPRPGAVSRRGLPGRLFRETMRAAYNGWHELNDTARLLAPAVGAIIAARAELRGIQIPDGFFELLTRTNSRLTFIPGDHIVPAGWPFTPGKPFPFQGETAEQLSKRVQDGDPDACIWPQITQDQVDTHMRETKAAGRDYYMAVDSTFFGVNWWGIPHPKDTKNHTAEWGQEKYPRMFVIGGETFDNFLIDDGLLPAKPTQAQKDQMKKLAEDVRGWYNVYSPANEQDMTNRAIETAIQATGEVLLARGLLQPFLSQQEVDRRAAIKTIFWTIAALKLAGAATILGSAASGTDNTAIQKAAEDAQNLIGYPLFNDKITSWLLARTAWAVEKADYISRQKGNTPIDIVYGTAHIDQIPGILTDRNFRMQMIKGFMRQHVQAIRDDILQNYPDLIGNMNSIISYSVIGTAFYTIQEIAAPWGKEKLEPGFDPVIDHKNDVFRFCPTIKDAALEVLKEFNVLDMHALQDAEAAQSRSS